MRIKRFAIDILVSVFLLIMVFLDVSALYPKLDGLAYYVFNTPYNSIAEGLLWLAVFLLAAFNANILSVENFGPAVFLAKLVAVILLVLSFRKFAHMLYFLYVGDQVVLIEPSESIYSMTMGRLLTLTVLIVSFAIILLRLRTRRSKTE